MNRVRALVLMETKLTFGRLGIKEGILIAVPTEHIMVVSIFFFAPSFPANRRQERGVGRERLNTWQPLFV